MLTGRIGAILCPFGIEIYFEHQMKVRYGDAEGKMVGWKKSISILG
jgi:hypothetical protein